MKTRIFAAMIVLGLAAPALAASAFDGTWKADLSKASFNEKPDIMILKGGVYRCPSCTPPYAVRADGSFHPAKGDGMDEMAVKIVDDHTIKTSVRYKGKLLGENVMTVLPDGKTATYHYVSYATPAATPPVYNGEEVRVAAGPGGSHAISGAWKYKQGSASASEGAMEMDFRVEGKIASMAMKTGVGYSATIGRPAVLIKGDAAGSMAAVKMTAPRTLVETDTLEGKAVGITTMTVAADGKTMLLTNYDPVRKTTDKLVLVKQ